MNDDLFGLTMNLTRVLALLIVVNVVSILKYLLQAQSQSFRATSQSFGILLNMSMQSFIQEKKLPQDPAAQGAYTCKFETLPWQKRKILKI